MSNGRITPIEQIAIDTAHAAVDADQHLSSTVDTVVFALSAVRLLASPEQALAEQLTGVHRTLAQVRARAREVWTPIDLIAVLDELLATTDADDYEFMTYRAELNGLPLGTYASAAAAKACCEDRVRRADPARRVTWVPDDGTPNSAQGLCTWSPDVPVDGDLQASGYVVIPVPVQGLFDPDADE